MTIFDCNGANGALLVGSVNVFAQALHQRRQVHRFAQLGIAILHQLPCLHAHMQRKG